MADELEGSPSPESSPESTTPSGSPMPASEPVSQPSQAAGSAAGSTVQGGSVAQPQQAPGPAPNQPSAAQAQQVADLRAFLRGSGMELPADDRAAAQQLIRVYQEAERARQYAPYVNSYMQHAQQFAEYQRAQSQNAAAGGAHQQGGAASQKPWYSQWWNPPEYNPSWDNMVQRDAQGNFVSVPGAPPDVVPKYLAHVQYQQDFARKFWQNPYTALEEPMRHMIREEAQRIASQNLDRYQDVQAANQFTQEHDAWLFERDQSGQQRRTSVFNPQTGRYETQAVLSVWGQKFRDYALDEAQYQQKNGIYDPERQKRVAMERVEREAAVYRLQQMQAQMYQQNQPAVASGGAYQQGAPGGIATQAQPQGTYLEQQNANFLAQNGNASPGRRGNTVTAPTPVTQMNLEQMLRESLAAAGNPEVFAR